MERIGGKPENTIIAFEPTGPYWMPFADFLEEQGYEWVFINPMYTKRYKDVLDNSPLKSDPKDAQVVLELLQMGRYMKGKLMKGAFRELHISSLYLRQLTKRRVILRNHIHSYLAMRFPEFLRIFKNPVCECARAILKKYPYPALIVKDGLSNFLNFVIAQHSVKIGRRWQKSKGVIHLKVFVKRKVFSLEK
ncbi:MAG: hypothetical protein A2161_12680 [Candidatus Schekmanbacteria bacterium RBG_13_48_7]|uniref:Transposase IS110-like N-terminal domain-containing protein n=1 Tax=Candidatus Schekmanbacteria bacterium RBG_13_48_7 TaxID=1817878 RepID=A0A1F7S2Q2_9BACT|nr:MAG: hypothetical protein A2161_12680 [Candidatus Schekmanbacteria bacterium RBG_13_48_7]